MTTTQTAIPQRLAYDYHEAAELLGISFGLVRKLVENGQLHAISIGRRRLIPVAELERVATNGTPADAEAL